MNAIPVVTGCLASVLAGAGFSIALANIERASSARSRHRAASVAFWFVAALPLVAPTSMLLVGDSATHLWTGTAGHVLPDTLPAQDWIIVAARAVVVAMVAWSALGAARLLLRLRRLSALVTGVVRHDGAGLPTALANVSGPLLIGYCAPVIVLPHSAAAHAPAVVDALKRHEEAHARRGDNWRLLAEHLALVLMPWCAPLKALHGYTLAAREELCDAWALRGTDGTTRSAYARALLDALRRSQASDAATSTMAGSLPAVRRRLSAILDTETVTPRLPWFHRIAAMTIASMGMAAAVAASGLQQGLETMAGMHGLALRFVAIGDGTSGRYHVSTWGGSRIDTRPAIHAGDYAVTFARDGTGGWIVTTVPTGLDAR